MHADARRRRLGRAVDAEHAGECLNDRLVAGLHPHRALVAERPQRARDQPGMRGAHRACVKPELLHHARPHVLHQHVALGDVCLEPGDRRGIAQVERNPALVVVHRVERVGGVRRERRAPIARVVAAVGSLELDDVRAEIREDAPSKWARQIVGDLDDPDSAQRQHVYRRPSRLRAITQRCTSEGPS